MRLKGRTGAGMRIERIEVFKANLPLKRPFRIAIGETRVAETLYIRIHADDGLYGMGEANLFTPVVGETQATAFAAAKDLAELLVGTDPLDIERIVSDMRRFMPSNPTTRSAFDMALYDLAGKVAGLPLYALLGGPRRAITTDNTVGIDSPEAMVEQALEIKGRGFPAVKIKVGTAAEEDIERVERIRRAVGPKLPIRIDANQGWDRVSAVRALRGMTDLGIEYCEQPVPVWDFESMRHVRKRTSIPIMADESVFDERDAFKLASMNACDFLNIKLAKSGGIHVALKINAVAEAAGMRCMVGCMTESRLGLSAGAHLVSSRPNIAFADLDGADMLKDDPVIGGMVYEEGGRIGLPEEPGLGADIDPEYLESLESYAVV
jgi:L-alanine-DL-glutamate epimerase-like enolase superfamily enzyme